MTDGELLAFGVFVTLLCIGYVIYIFCEIMKRKVDTAKIK